MSGEHEMKPVPPRRTRISNEAHAREYEELLATATQRECDAHYEQHGQGSLDPYSKLLPYPFIPVVGSMHAVTTKNAQDMHFKAQFMHNSCDLPHL